MKRTLFTRAAVLAAVAMVATFAVPLSAPSMAAEAVASGEQTAVPPSHPRLLFDGSSVEALRERIKSDVPKAAWERLRSRSDAYMTPGNPNYVAPELIIEDPYGWVYHEGSTKVHGTSLKPYDGLFGQSQLSTVLTELSFTYQLSQEEKYGRYAIEILLQLARKNWPVWACEGKVGPNQKGCDLGIGDQLAGIGEAFDWTYDLMSADERKLIIDKLVEYAPYLFGIVFGGGPSSNPQSNWMGVSSGGVGLTLLAIRGEPGVPDEFDAYLDQALLRTKTYLHEASTSQGDSVEGYVYAAYGLKNALPFALAGRRLGLEDVVTGSNAQRLAHWAVYEQIPGRGNEMVPLNDSTAVIASPSVLSYMMGMNPDDGITQWFWQRTAGPKGDDFYGRTRAPMFTVNTDCQPLEKNPAWTLGYCPIIRSAEDVNHILWWRSLEETPEVSPAQSLPLSQHFVEQGLVDSRTGFDGAQRDLVSTFSARRKAFGHYQFDLGSFTLYGAGANWAVDSSYSCVVCGKTADSGYAPGHNVVLIDGNKFTQSAADIRTSATTIDGHVSTPTFAWAHADLRYVYGKRSDGTFVSPHAGRDRFLSHAPGRPAILAVTDHLNRDTGYHKYRWQMHTDAANVVELEPGAPFGSGFRITAPNSAVMVGRISSNGTIAGDRPILASVFKQEVAQDIHPVHTVLYTDSVPAVTYDNLAVMAVTQPGEPAAAVTTLRVNGGNAAAVTSGGVTDVIASKLHTASAITGAQLGGNAEVATDGTFARLTRDAAQTLLVKGTSLTSLGRSYVAVTGQPATVSVSGTTAQAEGDTNNVYRVFAPEPLTSVHVNGVSTSSCRDGQYEVFPCLAPSVVTVTTTGPAVSTDVLPVDVQLSDAKGPLAGQGIVVQLAGAKHVVTTDSEGRADVFVPLDVDPGPYTIVATFEGSRRHAPSSAQQVVTVVRDDSVLRYVGVTSARGEDVNVAALLTDDEGLALPGQLVVFRAGDRVVQATTDAGGKAAAVLSVPDHGRSQIIEVDYAGATRYLRSSTAATVTWGGNREAE